MRIKQVYILNINIFFSKHSTKKNRAPSDIILSLLLFVVVFKERFSS